jgi:predicted nucleotidyltransferase
MGNFKYKYMLQKLDEFHKFDETHGILSIDEIAIACREVFEHYAVRYCYLFGSYAKGRAKETSDVDLLVATDVSGIQYYGMVEKLEEALHKQVDVLGIEQIINNKDLTDQILENGLKIYG